MRGPPSPRRIFVLVVSIIAVAFIASGGFDAGPVVARKGGGYGGGGGDGYGNKCKSTCKDARKTCFFCRKQDLKATKNTCKGKPKEEFRACRKTAKQTYKALKSDCRQRTNGCSSCCKQSYGSSCQGSFSGTPGAGTFFRRYCSGGGYGGPKKCHKEKPDCSVGGDDQGGGDDDDGGGGGPGTCRLLCEKSRAKALTACRTGCDTAAIEAAFLECLNGCGSAGGAIPPSSGRALLD